MVQTGFVLPEVRHNEGCVALDLREMNRACLLFNQSLVASCNIESECFNCTKHCKSDLGAGIYSAGLSLLKLSKPRDAFRFFAQAVIATDRTGSILGDGPHVWIRLAECCLQQEALGDREVSAAQTALTVGLPFLESISNNRSRRVFLR